MFGVTSLRWEGSARSHSGKVTGLQESGQDVASVCRKLATYLEKQL